MEMLIAISLFILIILLILLINKRQHSQLTEQHQFFNGLWQANAPKLDFGAICQTMPAGLGLLDHNLSFIYMNEQMELLAHVSAVQPRTLATVFPKLIDSLSSEQLQRLRSLEVLDSVEFSIRKGQSDEIETIGLACFSLATRSNGEKLGINIIVHDITAQKKAEENLKNNEERFRHAAHIAKLIVYEWDLKTGKVIRVSGLDEILGPHSSPGTSTVDEWRSRLHPDDLKIVLQKSESQISDDPGFDEEYRILNVKNEYIYLWDRGLIFRNQNDQPVKVIGVSIDIDARKKLEAQLQKYAQELAEADRRKDDFIAMLSHELRNPLTPINSAVAILNRLDLGHETADKAIAMITRQVKHMAHIVNDLLDISRITKGSLLIQKKIIDLTSVVQNSIQDYNILCQEKGLTLHSELPQSAIWIMGDETRLAQALGNILHNSLKFTETGGLIAVTLEADSQNGQARVSIRDTGIGIPGDMLPHIFEGFSQGAQNIARSKGGLGLGLALVKFIMDKHDAEISVMSRGLNTGSEFVIKIPVITIEVTADIATSSMSAVDTKNKLVLIIEDQPDILNVLQLFIEDFLHLKVVAANDALSGLAIAIKLQPQIIISDIGLPGSMDGYELAKAIRTNPKMAAAKMIALTGYGSKKDHQKSIEAGFDYHLVKPPNLDQLQEILLKETMESS